MPGGYKNIKPEDNTGGFQKNPQNINRQGKPRKLVNEINKQLKDEGYMTATKTEIIDAYQTIINLPLSKVREIADVNNDNYPILYKLVAKELLGKRGGDYLDKLLDRIIRPKQDIDITGGINIGPKRIGFTDE